jgi:hypothetical protein
MLVSDSRSCTPCILEKLLVPDIDAVEERARSTVRPERDGVGEEEGNPTSEIEEGSMVSVNYQIQNK